MPRMWLMAAAGPAFAAATWAWVMLAADRA
jgi:hypothetical protein